MQVVAEPREARPIKVIGRYALYTEIATGGMATVYIGRLLGPVGFSRTVAVKRLHQQFAKDPEFTAGFLDEARLAARIRHPNVIPTLDVVALEGELFLVMEYVQGESLSYLIRAMAGRRQTVPPPIAATLFSGVLQGLHAAHEAKSERGDPLGIVHRDVSPQNVLVGIDGVPRVLDFGVAKAVGRLQSTREGQLKGKLAYMAPEQVAGASLTRKSDIFSASVVFWEALTGHRLFRGENEADTLYNVLQSKVEPPSRFAKGIRPELDAVVLRGLERDAVKRWDTALEMAVAIEKSTAVVSPRTIGEWVEDVARDKLAQRQAQLAEIEMMPSMGLRASSRPPPAPADSSLGPIPAVPPAPSLPGIDDSVGASALSQISQTRKRRSLVAAVGVVAGIALLVIVWRLGAYARSAPAEAASNLTANPLARTTAPEPASVGASSAATAEPVVAPSAAAGEEPAAAAPSASASTAEPQSIKSSSRRRSVSRTRPATTAPSTKKPSQPVYSRE